MSFLFDKLSHRVCPRKNPFHVTSISDIAKQFGIRKQSVKEHISTILAKIGAANRSEAVAITMRKHLLKI